MDFKTNPPKRVLIINTFGLGDVLFTTPLISNLKANDPDVFIGYICNRRASALLEGNTKVDKIFVYERDEFYEVYKQSRVKFVQKFLRFLKGVKNEKFDMVFDMSLNRGPGFLTWMIGIKHRVGFNYKKRSIFLNHRIPFKGYDDRPVADYYLSLLEAMGGATEPKNLEFPIKRDEIEWADAFLGANELNSGQGPVIGLVPGGGASWGNESSFKRWPAEKYAKLADKLIEKFSATTILMGDENEIGLCNKVAEAMSHQPVVVCGKTTIGQFAALTQKCSLMIVNDGGPLHIAVAAGARTVSIFGPVDEHVYGPYSSDKHITIQKNLACRPCYRRFRKAHCEHVSCLNQLAVEEVLERIKEIL